MMSKTPFDVATPQRIDAEATAPHNGHQPTDRTLLGRLSRRLSAMPLRIQLWNGKVLQPASDGKAVSIRIASLPALLRVLTNPSFHLGEGYARGEVEVDGDLHEAAETIFRSWTRDVPATASTPRKTALRSARRNARHHYDLGNDFFRLWLDDQMLYSCAYFVRPEQDLEAAQTAKLDHVCRKLHLRPGDRVLEAGCGWGALARHMATRYGAEVTACNVSREQIRYARERAAAEGCADRVRFVEDDFRNVDGTYDAFVSVGMVEHVGLQHYRELGEVIHRRLDPEHGRGLLHFIGRNQARALNAWIRRRIFPNAYPPTLSEVFTRVLEPWDFSVLDVENLRLHYARTLEHWRARYENAAERVTAMFDQTFQRAWRLYLAGSQAAFTTGWLQLFQVTFNRGQDNDAPWTRAGLYEGCDPL
jgi:cyclopropane-fatty-acyl-phospholipid synthase